MNPESQDQISQVAKIMQALFAAFKEAPVILALDTIYGAGITDESIAQISTFADAGLTHADYLACVQLLAALSQSASAKLPNIAKMARLP